MQLLFCHFIYLLIFSYSQTGCKSLEIANASFLCNICKQAGQNELKNTENVSKALNNVANEVRGIKSMLSTLTLLHSAVHLPRTATTSSSTGTCKNIKAMNQQASNGPHVIDSGNRNNIVVFCDMKTLGGGWTLLLNQINSNYYSLTDSHCSDLTRLSIPGRQCELERILSVSTEILYTDASGNPFLHARINGGLYWTALHSSGSVPVAVTYLSGPLAGSSYNIEVNTRFHWGHRNYASRHGGKVTGISKYSRSCQHVCWEDVAAGVRDRPFLGAGCRGSSAISFCPAYDPPYVFPSQARRGGTFVYRKWVR